MRGKTHLMIGTLTTVNSALFLNFTPDILALVISVFLSILPDIDEPDSMFAQILVKKNFTKMLHRVIIYSLNILIFYTSIKLNRNLLFSAAVSCVSIIAIERLLTEKKVRKVLISLEFIMVAVLSYMVGAESFYTISMLVFAVMPFAKHRHITHSLFILPFLYYFLDRIEISLTKMNVFSFHGLAIIGTISYMSHIIGDLFTKMGVPLLYPVSRKNFSLGHIRVGSGFGNFLEHCIVIVLFALTMLSLYRYFF